MANDEHVALLKQGVLAWNAWREKNPDIRPDLSEADLGGVYLQWADLREAILVRANLSRAHLLETYLRRANLAGANLMWACLGGVDLREANLEGANLTEADFSRGAISRSDMSDVADLRGANLGGANLAKANLAEANLSEANLNRADLTDADLTGCRIYGVSAWGLKLEGAKQQSLAITPAGESQITVDDVEVAQFVYLLLHNKNIRKVIDTITSKVVLILGRFTDERKKVLDALREELRKRDYTPILFDFEKPRSRDTDETITLLARMAKFIIADVSDARSVLQELRAIVPDLPSVPVQSIILATQEEPGMFDFYRNKPSFLTVHRYADQQQLLADLSDKVIRPAELKVRELRDLNPT